MVESVDVAPDGGVAVTVLLTVAGCPLKDTINRDVTAAVSKVPGHRRGPDARRDDPEQRAGLQETLRGGQAQREILRAPDSLTKVYAIVRQGRRRQESSVTVNLAVAMAKQGMKVGIVDADIYGHSVPAMLGVGDVRPTQVEDSDHAGAHQGRHLGDLDRDAQAPSRPGRRLARPDARPGAGADAQRRLLGRLDALFLDLSARHRRHRDLARPAPAQRRGGRRRPAGGRRRGCAPRRWPR